VAVSVSASVSVLVAVAGHPELVQCDRFASELVKQRELASTLLLVWPGQELFAPEAPWAWAAVPLFVCCAAGTPESWLRPALNRAPALSAPQSY